jgi:hypothetical protein
MKLFDWGKTDAPRVDEHASSVGAANPAPDAGSVATATATQAREAAIKEATVSRRGRPRNGSSTVAPNGGTSERALQDQVNAQIAQQLDQLHDPKAWGALLTFPADTALALTGREHWKASRDERDTLGSVGSALARTMMITNPRSLALLMFSSAMISFYMPRALQELKHLKDEREKNEKEKPSAPATGS